MQVTSTLIANTGMADSIMIVTIHQAGYSTKEEGYFLRDQL